MKPSKGMQIEIPVRFKRGFTSEANHRHKRSCPSSIYYYSYDCTRLIYLTLVWETVSVRNPSGFLQFSLPFKTFMYLNTIVVILVNKIKKQTKLKTHCN